MPRHNGADRRLLLAGIIVAALSGGCGTLVPAPAGVVNLLEGPTHWLMLPDEEKLAHRLRSVPESMAFESAFWKRRDPDPTTPLNEALHAFNERVDAADHLYQEGALRGSLTDRGRALILLGAPPILRYGQRQIPTWEPGRSGAEPNVQTRSIQIETWAYPVDELPLPLPAAFHHEGYDDKIDVSFAIEPTRSYLTSGERYLELAARATAHEE